MSEFDPYHFWLGIPPADQPPNHYRLLGIDLYETDSRVIDHAADRQMTFLHECSLGEHLAESQQLLNEVSAARICLLDPQAKAGYDETLETALHEAPADDASADESEHAYDQPRRQRPNSQPRRKKKGGFGVVLAAALGGVTAIGLLAMFWGDEEPEPETRKTQRADSSKSELVVASNKRDVPKPIAKTELPEEKSPTPIAKTSKPLNVPEVETPKPEPSEETPPSEPEVRPHDIDPVTAIKTPEFQDAKLIGKWMLLNDKGKPTLYITLDAKGNVTTNSKSKGKWEVVGSEVRVTMDVGHKRLVRFENGRYVWHSVKASSDWEVEPGTSRGFKKR